MIAEKYQGEAMRSATHDQETGSSACSNLMKEESYTCFMLFYVRESSRSDQLARNEFEDDDVLHYYYDDKIACVGGNDYVMTMMIIISQCQW